MYTKETNQFIREFRGKKELYEDFSELISSLLKTFLSNASIPYYTIEHRCKTIESLREKIQRKRLLGKRYEQLTDISDLSGVRVILFFSDDVSLVKKILDREFALAGLHDKTEDNKRRRQASTGYSAEHEIIQLSQKRLSLSEYKRFKSIHCEIQIKTILQHAWAEIEHDIGYKPKVKETDLERSEIRKLFRKNAVLLKKVDENFISIREKHIELLTEYTQNIERRKLGDLPLNHDTVEAYLRKKLNIKTVPRNLVIKVVEISRIHHLKNILHLDDYLKNKNPDLEI